MASVDLEARLAVLEQEVARLRSKVEGGVPRAAPWWERIAGTFANDRTHEEAMRLGRKYRESLRPRDSGARKG
jgi:hypothetical protein